ncbi:hypothetical protein TNCV_4636331 [Trichonephila clavipes]|uniref:Uncharacterized protein n=1 Tax=Trichonephila clavipes TaxID=2585209 RepID=A0A8X6UYG6_TRICX|nr:hypothetical protein TNCV_4636331 [Trichonephila clavipes]
MLSENKWRKFLSSEACNQGLENVGGTSTASTLPFTLTLNPACALTTTPFDKSKGAFLSALHHLIRFHFQWGLFPEGN